MTEYSLKECQMQIDWAKKVLAAPAVTYQNGRNSHEVAGEVLEKYEDAMLDYAGIQVLPNGGAQMVYVERQAA